MEINRIDNLLEIIVPVSKYRNFIFLFGITAIITTPLFILVLIKIIISLDFDIPIEICGPLFWSPFSINLLLWFLKGKEKLIFKNENVIYIKTNGIITLSKVFEKKAITNMREIEKTFKSDSFLDVQRQKIKDTQGAFPFWERMGKIIFEYKGNSKTIFNGLNSIEMIEVSKILNEELNKK